MFEYRCPACGASGLSSASYSTVGVCPACGALLGSGASPNVPEPDPISWADQRAAWARSAYHEIGAGPPVREGSNMPARNKAALTVGRLRVQAAEAIDVALWRMQRRWALIRRKPWPPRAHPALAPVPERRRSVPAVTPARAVAIGSLLVALLAVGFALHDPDDPRATTREAKVKPLIDRLPPYATAEAAPRVRVRGAREDHEGRGATSESRGTGEELRDEKARDVAKARASRKPRRSERDRAPGRPTSGRPPSGGGSPAAESPAAPGAAPVTAAPAAPEPAEPAPVAAPAPPPTQEAPAPDDGGATRGGHPHGGPPGQSGGREGK